MGAILGSLPAVIWLIVILLVVSSAKKNKAKQKKPAEQKFQQKPEEVQNAGAGSGMISRDVQRTAAAKKKQSGMKDVKKAPSGLASTGIHDDKNDWLSQQYAEEKRSERLMSAMFGLKMHHAQNCDAKKIREEHEANCAAEKVKKYSRK